MKIKPDDRVKTNEGERWGDSSISKIMVKRLFCCC